MDRNIDNKAMDGMMGCRNQFSRCFFLHFCSKGSLCFFSSFSDLLWNNQECAFFFFAYVFFLPSLGGKQALYDTFSLFGNILSCKARFVGRFQAGSQGS